MKEIRKKWYVYLLAFFAAAGLVYAQQDILRQPKTVSGPANDGGFARKNIGAQHYQEVTTTTTTPAVAIPDGALIGFISWETNVNVTSLSGMTAGRIYKFHLSSSSASNVVFTRSASLRLSSTNANGVATLTPTNMFTVYAVSDTVAKIQVPETDTVP